MGGGEKEVPGNLNFIPNTLGAGFATLLKVPQCEETLPRHPYNSLYMSWEAHFWILISHRQTCDPLTITKIKIV